MTGPVRSMTGAGAAVLEDPALGRFEAEARSVNHRFLKTSVRTSGPLPPVDGAIEDLVRGRLQRGHVTVSVRFTPPAGPAVASRIDEAAFAAAAARLRAVATANGLATPTAADVLSVPGVVADARAGPDAEGAAARAVEAVERALGQLDASREREGGMLREEMRGLLAGIEASTQAIAAAAGNAPARIHERLVQRMGEILRGAGAEPDPAVVAREAALIADRADVREELARLAAHAAHARALLAEGGTLGRRMDFLAQELHREANTVGSKSSDLETTRAAMDLKTHVERLREQVQNLE